jgi:EAL domain-containing protein (putative c-di-GMP-specific phosphodiesterase class I)
MVDPPPTESPDTDTCSACADGIQTSFGFSMAFQPIVDAASARVFAYEALVRGPTGEPALSVLRQVTRENRYAFDQSCRRRAVELAAQLGMAEAGAKLSINFMPGAMYSPKSCVRVTLAAAKRYNFPSENIIFELTEDERIHDFDFVRAIFGEYRNQGFSTAIDDFGAGYAALNLLAEYHPDLIRLCGRNP